MQRAARSGGEAAALFLATHGAKVNHVNKLVCMTILPHRSQTVQTCRVHLVCPFKHCNVHEPFSVVICNLQMIKNEIL